MCLDMKSDFGFFVFLTLGKGEYETPTLRDKENEKNQHQVDRGNLKNKHHVDASFLMFLYKHFFFCGLFIRFSC